MLNTKTASITVHKLKQSFYTCASFWFFSMIFMIFFLNLCRLRESQKTQFDKKCCTRYIRKLYIHAAIYDDQTLILFVF